MLNEKCFKKKKKRNVSIMKLTTLPLKVQLTIWRLTLCCLTCIAIHLTVDQTMFKDWMLPMTHSTWTHGFPPYQTFLPTQLSQNKFFPLPHLNNLPITALFLFYHPQSLSSLSQGWTIGSLIFFFHTKGPTEIWDSFLQGAFSILLRKRRQFCFMSFYVLC